MIQQRDRNPVDKWDEYFLGIADHVSSMSKDPSTKVGAVIVRPDLTICSTGFNGFPSRIEDKNLDNREYKLARVIHAEMNALLFAKESVDGYTLYSTLFPCERCAVHIIQAGIIRVISNDKAECWNHSLSEDLFNEASVLTTK